MMDIPQRKRNRLKSYDYSTPGAYFITVCTKERQNLLWENVGASNARPPQIVLSEYGQTVEAVIQRINRYYPSVSVENYTIMPNHIHLLLQVHETNGGRPLVAPTISQIVQQLKGQISKQLGSSIWQRSFHDHIIRSDADYRMIWEYIDTNPQKW
ncbi:MAG: transposase, partial [Firmicutes bacterium]|nr:transposase [Bacillota bacterium]